MRRALLAPALVVDNLACECNVYNSIICMKQAQLVCAETLEPVVRTGRKGRENMRALLVAASLAAVTTAAPAVELTIWAHPAFTPSAGLPSVAEAYEKAYADFQAANPDITLQYEVMRGGTEALQQFLTAATGDNLPDLALLDGFWISRLVETGELQPLNDLWSEEARANWLPASVDAVTLNGNVYAVPFHTSWRGLFYPISTMNDLGYESPPQDWQEFLEFGEKAKADGMYATMLPGGAGEVSALHLISMFWGLGGELVDETGKPVFFEGDSRAALEQVYGLYRELVEKEMMPADIATIDEGGIRTYLYSGETATGAASSSHVTSMYTDNPSFVGNLGIMNYPLPEGSEAVPLLTGFTYGIFTSDPERQQAAWKFIEFLTEAENIGPLNANAGHLPVVTAVWEQDFYENDPLMQQFRAIVEDGGMRPRPSVPIYPVLANALSTQLAGVVSGAVTPAQAVDNARNEVMAEYERMASR